MIRILLMTVAVFANSAWAAGSNSSSGSGSSDKSVKPLFELTLGTSSLHQTIDQPSFQNPPAGRLAGYAHYGPILLGASYMTLIHSDTSASGTANEVDSGEELDLIAGNVGLLVGNFLLIEGGYGVANFKRTSNIPNATNPSTFSATAQGAGSEVGGSLIPVHIGRTAIGASYYYFDATASKYNSSYNNTTTSTTVTGQTANVHSYGWMAGASFLWGF